MHNAQEKLEREKMTRTEILRSFLSKACEGGCGGDWLRFATDVLLRNDISFATFTSAVLEAIEKGRGKYRNILITGPANCGKTFILSPLTTIFDAFCNPASTSFAWVGADQAEIIYIPKWLQMEKRNYSMAWHATTPGRSVGSSSCPQITFFTWHGFNRYYTRVLHQ